MFFLRWATQIYAFAIHIRIVDSSKNPEKQKKRKSTVDYVVSNSMLKAMATVTQMNRSGGSCSIDKDNLASFLVSKVSVAAVM